MNRKLIAGGALLAAGVVVFGVVMMRRHRGPHHAHHEVSAHGNGIDQSDPSVSFETMLNAPELATPCETAYGAIEAEQNTAKLRGTQSIFQWVAPKPDFLAACQSMTPDQQRCMPPRYRKDHEDECKRSRPDTVVLKKMVVGVPVPEPTVPQ